MPLMFGKAVKKNWVAKNFAAFGRGCQFVAWQIAAGAAICQTFGALSRACQTLACPAADALNIAVCQFLAVYSLLHALTRGLVSCLNLSRAWLSRHPVPPFASGASQHSAPLDVEMRMVSCLLMCCKSVPKQQLPLLPVVLLTLLQQ